MKTLLENVSYSEDLSSAYISNKEVEEYAKQTEQDYEDAFNDLESNLPDYSYVETELDGRIIFHKEADLRDIAEREDLEYIETTDQRNGYPSRIKGAIIGFNSFEQAQELADKEHLQITTFEKRDGWDLWYRTMNSVCEPFTNSCDDYGDDYSEFGKMSESDFIMNEVLPLIVDCNSFESIEKLLKQKKEIFEEIENLEDGQMVITNCGSYYETINMTSMSFYHDTKNYAIGLIKRLN